MTDILRTGEMLNLALSSILKGVKNEHSIYPSILIRNDSLTSQESKAKNCL